MKNHIITSNELDEIRTLLIRYEGYLESEFAHHVIALDKLDSDGSKYHKALEKKYEAKREMERVRTLYIQLQKKQESHGTTEGV